MQRLTRERMFARVEVLVAGLVMMAGWTRAEAFQAPSNQAVAAAGSAQATSPAVAAGQAGSLQAYECVQVPVTYNQTLYRQECRTETVPVTRMVREVVNETRSVTCYTRQQEMVTKQVTRFVCEPTTVVLKSYRPVPVSRMVERPIYQTYCTTEMVNKVITRMIPECVTETVPVTKMRKVVEPQVCYVTQRIPSTSYVPVVTCVHSCGHRCGGGCGQCGGATACVQYRPVTTCTYQQVPVTRPAVRLVPETCYVQRTRTKFNPVQETITVPVKKLNRVQCGVVNQCVTDYQMQAYDCTVTKMVARPVTETVTVCETKMIPNTSTVTVPVAKCRPVTEYVPRQVSVCVPYQVPVTVMTTQTRPVAQPAAAAQSAPASSQTGASPQGSL
jgi:hypothetical protein